MSLQEIEYAVKHLDEPEQRKLLQDLPRLIDISKDDLAWMKVAEPSFEFWDHEEDAIHDKLSGQGFIEVFRAINANLDKIEKNLDSTFVSLTSSSKTQY